MKHDFDIVVIGGGHAGVEAAAVCARIGLSVALITMRRSDLGMMSCNPAFGGIGKGHLIREVDAFGGIMGLAADEAAIHYRLLNRSKGPAVQGPRCQADRDLYARAVGREIHRSDRLRVLTSEVIDLAMADGIATGVVLSDGSTISARCVILTAGTFLRGRLHVGGESSDGGRRGAQASNDLAARLRDHGTTFGRLKTGTPPRLDGRSIDWNRVARQYSDSDPTFLSMRTQSVQARQVPCGITRTTSETIDHVGSVLHRSAMKAGNIDGTGPRYCPSIEDKVERFPDRTDHQVFLEPEGLRSISIYPNGISTSLPRPDQDAMIRTIPGLANARITAYGYAVEYDYMNPGMLSASLEHHSIAGLFVAGQINGTTGYEEAAAQGLVAGLGAACRVRDVAVTEFTRANSYIGVMIDDLRTKPVTEPYRMFTSRAEFRLSLRCDNAEDRLGEMAAEAGALNPRYARTVRARIRKRVERIAELKSGPVDRRASVAYGLATCRTSTRRVAWDALVQVPWEAREVRNAIIGDDQDERFLQSIHAAAIYSVYEERQRGAIDRMNRDRDLLLDDEVRERATAMMSAELRQKVRSGAPKSVAEASSIEGMTPSALMILVAHAREQRSGQSVSRET